LTAPAASSRVASKMRDTQTNLEALVVAAQGGDRRSLDELVSGHLPFVYAIVRRALGDHPDTDDLVQEIVLRAVRELRELRTPQSFRPWLAAIAVRQVGTYLQQRRLAVRRTAPLDEAVDTEDAAADVEGLTVLRLDLSGQRGEVVRAERWLDPDDRALLSLWWLEVDGRLTRAELAEALGITVPHAGVRVQRMRAQLDVSRSVVAALDAAPRCRRLTSLTARWDGQPNAMWRKRIGRHVRSCADCGRAADGRAPLERLLVGAALLPVPAGLAAELTAKVPFAAAAARAAGSVPGTGGVRPGPLADLARAAVAHPVAAACLVATLVAGAALSAANWPPATESGTPRPTRSVVAPAPAPSTFTLGPASLEAANQAGSYVAITSTFGVLSPVGQGSDSQVRQRATFEVVAGLADPDCFSFRLPDGRYLRHSSWRLRVFADDGTPLFRGDATFCVRLGAVAGSVSLESKNYPGWFLRHRGDEVWVDQSNATPAFAEDSSFRIRPPLAT
jgi:RNA polymerase sigma factor (sigma-70 family)